MLATYADRIVQQFDGMTITTGEVAKAFDVSLSTASASLRRLAERRAVERVKLGRWYVKRAAQQGVDADG